ncbi:MAG TPA: MarR family winged helix-turn-helix transcriptional regulator [Acidobacteriaceae bacterium]|jgi:DNA-binding MarR family transcriptional regulator|nr:MarR family winged helix-turn-helix transcriptional regulator [Acidobacteriaceae bacterium]
MVLPSAAKRSSSDYLPSQESGVVQELAWFRYNLRKFLRFSEKAARQCGVTPQQHQLMLGIAGYTGRGWATLSELAEFLQERHNSVVGLVERAVERGLVRKVQDKHDRRFVFVSLTRRGEVILSKLTDLHKEEVQRVRGGLLTPPKMRPQHPELQNQANQKNKSHSSYE